MSSTTTAAKTTTPQQEEEQNVWDMPMDDNSTNNNKNENNDNNNNSTETYELVNPKSAPKRKVDKSQLRSIRVPANRHAALKAQWENIYTPIVEKLELQVRMNTKRRCVEIRLPPESNVDVSVLQKAADFVQAFLLGFEVADALALLRLDDLYIESFDIKDVKRSLTGDHLSRTIARIAGKNGSVKFTIENSTKTRVLIANTRIHILGSFQNISVARNAISDLILGSPPGVVYNKLRIIASRMKESF